MVKNIFRLYDIRGVYPNELNEEDALLIGKALGTFICKKIDKQNPTAVVGQDTRQSSSALAKALIKGLVSTGVHVTDVGISLTPIIHFLTCTEDFDLGIEVTASHNPKQFNGFRLDFRGAVPLDGEYLQEVYKIALAHDFVVGEGSVTTKDLSQKYIDYLAQQFSFSNTKIKVVIDCHYGTVSQFAEKIFARLGISIDPIFCTIDSTFPVGVPDPENKKNLETLQKTVVEHGADVGFSFDEDSDRMGFVDNKGHVYNNDYLLMLFAKYVLQDNPGAKVVFDVKSSSLLFDVIKQYGGVPEISRTGHTFLVRRVQDDCILGGEFSGHILFSDRNFGYDDGIYAACRLLEILAKEKVHDKSLNDLMSEFPTRPATDEIKIDCSDDQKFTVVEQITQKIKADAERYQQIYDFDGIRAHVTDTGWFLIRASNTSPYLSVRAEGKDKAELERMVDKVGELMALHNIAV